MKAVIMCHTGAGTEQLTVGNIAVFETLQSLGIINAVARSTGEAAATWGHFDQVQWLHEHQELELSSQIFQLAADSRGGLEMLQWLHAHGCPWSSSAYGSAVQHRRLDILQWLRAEECPLDEWSGGRRCKGVITIAAAQADVAILTWLLQQDTLELQACDIEAAAGAGHLAGLQLLHERGCPMDAAACTAAAAGNHLAVLQWLRQCGCPWDEHASQKAAWLGHLEMLQWMVQETAPWNPSRCYSYAQTNKHTVVAEWIHNNHLKKGKKKNKKKNKKS
jgi:hypothetical protein